MKLSIPSQTKQNMSDSGSQILSPTESDENMITDEDENLYNKSRDR